MQSFKAFIAKEFKQIYRDRRTLLVLFGMPVIQMLLFGFAIRNEVENARVMVLDTSRDEVTRQLMRPYFSREILMRLLSLKMNLPKSWDVEASRPLTSLPTLPTPTWHS